MRHASFYVVLSLAAASTGQAGAEPARKTVASIADLPRFSYPYTGDVAGLLEHPERLTPFVDKVEADVRQVLDDYDIRDRSTLRGLHQTLLDIAEFRGDGMAVRHEVAIMRDLSDKPVQRATAGDIALITATVRESITPASSAFGPAFQRAYSASIAKLPWSLYGERAQQNAGQLAMLSTAVTVGGVAPLFQPQVDKGGALDETAIREIIGYAVMLRDWVPIKPQMMAANSAYIAANQQRRTDIWPARDLVLPTTARLVLGAVNGRGRSISPTAA